MKKFLTIVCILALLAGMLCAGASADYEGTDGSLFRALEKSGAWKDYAVEGTAAGPFAVMRSGDSSALFYADREDNLHVYPAAVYQPDDGKPVPELDWDGRYLTIAYGENEKYTFCEITADSGDFCLTAARIGWFYLKGSPPEIGYAAADNDWTDAVALEQGITLSGFNIRLLPRSAGEVRHINYMRARFNSGLNIPDPGDNSGDGPDNSFVHIDVKAMADTYLTDDPDGSQRAQFEIVKGTKYQCLGLYNDYYAYVAAPSKDGGVMPMGFVPVRDLIPVEQDRPADTRKLFAGEWMLASGGGMAEGVLRFSLDGTFTTAGGDEKFAPAGADSGTWYLTKYNPAMNLYPDHIPYEITMRYNNGRAAVYGLIADTDGFSLVSRDSVSGYVPYEEAPYFPEEDYSW